MNEDSALILHPRIWVFRSEIERLQSELSETLTERFRLTYEVAPRLTHRFSELFGALERDLEQRTLEMSEKKRSVELLALKLDRGQQLDRALVELTLKAVRREFSRIRRQVMRQRDSGGSRHVELAGAAGVALDREQKRQETDQLRHYYRRLAKLLHPDLTGHRLPIYRSQWDLVQWAYDRRDLSALRALWNLSPTFDALSNSREKQIEVLAEALEREHRLTTSLLEREPLSLAAKLDSEDWIAERRSKIEKEIGEVEREIEKCDRFLKPILEEYSPDVDAEEPLQTWDSFVEDVYLSGRF